MLKPLMALQDARDVDKNLYFPSAESDALQFLDKIDAIDTSGAQCHACVFHEKADFYFTLIDFAPSIAIKERVANHLVQFLAADSMEQQSPMEWLFRVKLLLNLTRYPDDSQVRKIEELARRGLRLTMLPSDARLEILKAMRLKGNEVMSVYVAADRALYNKYVLPPV
jgi:hypothetical protein